MKIIGLTGGIGSGKSTIAKVFETFGAKLFIADLEANIITATHPTAIAQISQTFGNTIYQNGKLNKKELASIVFGDNDKLQKLNAIVHPLVKQAFDNFVNINKHTPYIILESAILVQCGFYRFTDFNILVTAPENIRIQRVVKRNNITEKQVRNRISAQIPDNQSVKYCKYTIINDNFTMVVPQVKRIIYNSYKNE